MRKSFATLDNLLRQYQHYWRFEPFHESRDGLSRFQSDSSGLFVWLNQLDLQQVQQLKLNPCELIDKLAAYIECCEQLTDLCDIPPTQSQQLKLDVHQASGIPGRKLSQIEAMGSAAVSHHQGQYWLEWCAGKGFLGRMLAAGTQQSVTSFEWQHALCHKGQHEANKLNLPLNFVQGDAFCCDKHHLFSPPLHAVALHACGDLHVELMKQGSRAQIANLSIAPCCYHLIRDDSYQPLSDLGRLSSLHLSKSELRIPLQETVTGGERVLRHRQLEMVYRLGLDELLTSLTKTQHYQPIPSIKKSQLQHGFEAFCHWAAKTKGFDLPLAEWDKFEQMGQARFLEMERLSLVQQVFLRPLEMWLVFDKALFLQEQGYAVSLSQFCDKKITPRNILIQAALLDEVKT
ncbi:SAM-dependent methyltransferase [Vibrio gallicus]|uniref:SAM-dependent methyltransferase n=1 Tax=Vibrio gallicus TaxID=190897 RepID=UPI0021C2AD54|nr:SAM-dependent methyltransferase [Vibrio gallicus]